MWGFLSHLKLTRTLGPIQAHWYRLGSLLFALLMVLLWAFKNTHRTSIMLDANVITNHLWKGSVCIYLEQPLPPPPPPRIKMTCREAGGHCVVEEIYAHECWLPVYMLPFHVSRQGSICIWRRHGKDPGWLWASTWCGTGRWVSCYRKWGSESR